MSSRRRNAWLSNGALLLMVLIVGPLLGWTVALFTIKSYPPVIVEKAVAAPEAAIEEPELPQIASNEVVRVPRRVVVAPRAAPVPQSRVPQAWQGGWQGGGGADPALGQQMRDQMQAFQDQMQDPAFQQQMQEQIQAFQDQMQDPAFQQQMQEQVLAFQDQMQNDPAFQQQVQGQIQAFQEQMQDPTFQQQMQDMMQQFQPNGQFGGGQGFAFPDGIMQPGQM